MRKSRLKKIKDSGKKRSFFHRSPRFPHKGRHLHRGAYKAQRANFFHLGAKGGRKYPFGVNATSEIDHSHPLQNLPQSRVESRTPV
jgi:hypothetical protein